MSQQSQSSPTTQAAKDEAGSVGRTAQASGGQVAGTARDEGQRVASEAAGHARDLAGQTRDQVSSQVEAQQERAAGNLRSLGDELSSMAENSEESGLASELVGQASDRVHQVAGWLDDRQPQDLLEEVRTFARQRPGAFLLGAAVAGLAVGRLSRAGVDAKRDTSGDSPSAGEIQPSYSSSTSQPAMSHVDDTTTQTRVSSDEGELWPVGERPVAAGTTTETGYDDDFATPRQPAGTEPGPGIPGTTNDPAGPPR